MKIWAGQREVQSLELDSNEWSLRSAWDRSAPSVRVRYLALHGTAGACVGAVTAANR